MPTFAPSSESFVLVDDGGRHAAERAGHRTTGFASPRHAASATAHHVTSLVTCAFVRAVPRAMATARREVWLPQSRSRSGGGVGPCVTSLFFYDFSKRAPLSRGLAVPVCTRSTSTAFSMRALLVDPVQTVHGQTNERAAIEDWFTTNKTDPRTGETLLTSRLSILQDD